MLRTLIVGLGRSGAGLHLPVIDRLRRNGSLDATAPVHGLDPACQPGRVPGLVLCADPAEAAARTDPGRTVVHVCTPPNRRAGVLRDLAGHGFTRFLVEKPLAADDTELDAMLRTAAEHRLRILPVCQWQSSGLTRRISEGIAEGALGPLRGIRLIQRKPRFTRSLTDVGHPTAFDVEVPHALGVALTLAGPGRVRDAGWSDLRTDTEVRPRLGHAWLTVAHDGGVRTRIESWLCAPTRERRIVVSLESGSLTGYYPCSDADSYAQLTVRARGWRTGMAFEDDSLTAAVRDAYRRFGSAAPDGDDDLALNAAVVRMLADAKRLAGSRS